MTRKQRDARASLVLAVVYAVLAAGAATGRTSPLDRAARRRLKRPRRGAGLVTAEAVRRAGQPWMQIGYAALAARQLRRAHLIEANAVMTSVLTAFLADSGTKMIVRRRRPPTYRGTKTFESFPSGHTATAAAFALSAAFVLEQGLVIRAPRATLLAYAAAASVGLTRLALDDHWITDIVGGLLLGSAAVYAAFAMETSGA